MFETACPFCDLVINHQTPSGVMALLAVHFGEQVNDTTGHGWDRVADHLVDIQISVPLQVYAHYSPTERE